MAKFPDEMDSRRVLIGPSRFPFGIRIVLTVPRKQGQRGEGEIFFFLEGCFNLFYQRPTRAKHE